MSPLGRRTGALFGVLAFAASGCELLYPEVVVESRTDEQVLVRNASFSGCLWPEMLARGEVSRPQRCLPGEDRLHFERLDVAAYGGAGGAGGSGAEPTWFPYQTVRSWKAGEAGYDELLHIEIRSDDLEQDFSVPGPYGH